MSLREKAAAGAYRVYKYTLSPALHLFGGGCRFQPTCSEYAAIAVSEYGLMRGGWMALRRLLRCHPFAKGGFDPVKPNPRAGNHNSHTFSQRPLP